MGSPTSETMSSLGGCLWANLEEGKEADITSVVGSNSSEKEAMPSKSTTWPSQWMSQIIHVPEPKLAEFQSSLKGKKLLFAKGFGQNNWGEKGHLANFDGFLKHNDNKMLNQILDTISSFGLTSRDFIVIDGDPVNAGFQIFVRWVCKTTSCRLIWAKKLPALSLTPEKQQEAKDEMWADVKTWEDELRPLGTRIYFVEISHERQDDEMLKIFGKELLPQGPTERPRFNTPINFFELAGEMQRQMEIVANSRCRKHEIVAAYARDVKGYSQKGPLEFCAFENAAKGLVIRSLLRSHAQSNLTLLTGGGQASVLETAAFLLLGDVDSDTELAVFPASRGKAETDPVLPQVLPRWAQEKESGSPKRPTCNLFCCHQFTQEASRRRDAWLPNKVDIVKASTPPFNTRLGVDPPRNSIDLNIATFGVKLPQLIMKLFESPEMKRLSSDLSIPIPAFALDTFVQKKMPKVLDLVAEARRPQQGLGASDLNAVSKLERFCNAFTALDGNRILGPGDFQAFVEQYVDAGWEDHLHFDSILVKIFGMSQNMSEKLRNTKIKVVEKDREEEVTLEHHALRWLSKAFKGYGPVGCLTDVVNLVYAMLKLPQSEEAFEQEAMNAVVELQASLDRGEFHGLWIPTHLAHDMESDDALAWLLLEFIHRAMGTTLKVLIQLPTDTQFDQVEAFLKEKHAAHVDVFRDKDSANGKAVGNVWWPVAAQGKESRASQYYV